MPMTDGILEAIDKKIAKLQDIRKQVIEEFGGQNGAGTKRLPPAKRSGGKTRKQELAEFLKAHGPMVRGEIIKQAGLPEGTIGYCLLDKKRFTQDEEGKWLAK